MVLALTILIFLTIVVVVFAFGAATMAKRAMCVSTLLRAYCSRPSALPRFCCSRESIPYYCSLECQHLDFSYRAFS